MKLVCVGTSHHTSGVALRERLAFTPGARREALEGLAAGAAPVAREAAVVCTCNRTELYAVGADDPPGSLAGQLAANLAEHAGASAPEIAPHLRVAEGADAARHLLRVAAGLDSMILGEAQILGQLREAIEEARGVGAAGPVLGALFTAALRAGRRARSETAIGAGAASVPSAAVALAGAAAGGVAGSRIVVVGAGKMGALTAKALLTQGAHGVVVSNRSYARAVEMARDWGGCAVTFDRLPEVLAEADIVIASTGAPHPVLGRALVAAAMAGRPERPLTIVDIAVPRDVEPEVGQLAGVRLFDLDDLDAAVEDNLAERRAALPAVEAILDEEEARFRAWLASRGVVPTIAELRRWADGVREAELERALRRLGTLGDGEREAVRALSVALVGKLLHPPVSYLRASADGAEGVRTADALRALFGLEGPPPPDGDGAAPDGPTTVPPGGQHVPPDGPTIGPAGSGRGRAPTGGGSR